MKVLAAVLVERCRTKMPEASTNGIKIRRRPRRHCDGAEDGYVLVAVIFMMALLVLSLSVAVPRVKEDIQRDHELEAIHRGKQYVRAIQLYYRKFHRYPPDANALENSDGIRFLRKRYTDPITGKDDWQPIPFGQNKVPIAMGLFGVPLPGSSGVGTGASGTANTGSGSSGFGSGSSFGNSSSNTGFGNSSNTGFGSSGNASSSNSPSGQGFGGLGIMGFTIPIQKQSILIYKSQDHYDAWEFCYSPSTDIGGGMVGGAAANGAGNSGNSGSSGGLGGNSSGSTNNGWSPNGNLPSPGAPGSGAPTSNPWSPNGNLPSPSQP